MLLFKSRTQSGCFSPDELVHELPALSVDRGENRPHESKHEEGFHALLEVLGGLWGLPNDTFERPELLEVAV